MEVVELKDRTVMAYLHAHAQAFAFAKEVGMPVRAGACNGSVTVFAMGRTMEGA